MLDKEVLLSGVFSFLIFTLLYVAYLGFGFELAVVAGLSVLVVTTATV